MVGAELVCNRSRPGVGPEEGGFRDRIGITIGARQAILPQPGRWEDFGRHDATTRGEPEAVGRRALPKPWLILNWHQGYGRRRASRTSQPKPEAKFEPKREAWHLSLLSPPSSAKESENRGSDLSRVHSFGQEEGSPSPLNRDHELITQSSSSGRCVTRGCHHTPLLKVTVNQDSSRAICPMPCSEVVPNGGTREIEEGSVRLGKVSSTSQSGLTNCYL